MVMNFRGTDPPPTNLVEWSNVDGSSDLNHKEKQQQTRLNISHVISQIKIKSSFVYELSLSGTLT